MLPGVLVEHRPVKQETGSFRRWFKDEALELIVWHETAGDVSGFQLCYPGHDNRERALTWHAGAGFSHARIQSGDTNPFKNETPILVPDGAAPWGRITALFLSRGAQLNPALHALIGERLLARH